MGRFLQIIEKAVEDSFLHFLNHIVNMSGVQMRFQKQAATRYLEEQITTQHSSRWYQSGEHCLTLPV